MNKEKIESNEVEVLKEDNEPKVSKLKQARGNHKVRIWVIVSLMAITAVLFIFFEKLRIFLIAAFLVLLAALGLEVSQNDWDLGKLIQTRSVQESKVSRDDKGNILFDKFGEITTDTTKGKKADEYNCADFESQPEAQQFFVKVGGTKNDVNRLDGNKDGDACEALPNK